MTDANSLKFQFAWSPNWQIPDKDGVQGFAFIAATIELAMISNPEVNR